MVATQYYIGNRPVDEVSIRNILLSALDGAVGKLFEESADGFMKIFFQLAGPGATADQVDFVLNNDDEQRLDVYFANELIGPWRSGRRSPRTSIKSLRRRKKLVHPCVWRPMIGPAGIFPGWR